MRNLITKRPWLVATSAMAVALMAVTFLAAISFAGQVQAQPNQDTGGMFVPDLFVMDSVENQGWTTITGLEGWYKTANDKELVIDVSLECGLYTDTAVASKAGDKETAYAEAGVQVRVLIDGEYAAEPGIVTFCRRSQMLSATFQGLLTDVDGNVCLTTDPETLDITIDEDCLRPEEVQLILDTTNANAFNFVAFDLAAGGEGHTIEVQSKISTDFVGEDPPKGNGKTSDGGTASANAVIGKGSAIVYETR
ncbi:MAG: hypothetical protein IH870_02400, partial [Chloroflexi bacterium]|nr:hypothetical protein [Chloroflexota bacterium]